MLIFFMVDGGVAKVNQIYGKFTGDSVEMITNAYSGFAVVNLLRHSF
jgi:hypothetical protein